MLAVGGLAILLAVVLFGWVFSFATRRSHDLIEKSRIGLIGLLPAALLGMGLGAWAGVAVTPQMLKDSVVQTFTGKRPGDSGLMAFTPERAEWLKVIIRPRAEAGDGFAQFVLSESFRNGAHGVPRDGKAANYWLDKAVLANDFDAILTQAVDARPPRSQTFNPADSDGHVRILALREVLTRAPELRKPAVNLLLAELSGRPRAKPIEGDTLDQQLRNTAALGSAIAAVRLASILEGRSDAVEAHALYGWAGARWDAAKVWEVLTEDQRFKAKARRAELNAQFRKPQVADPETLERVRLRAILRGALDRASGSSSVERDDGAAHGLAAVELSGYDPSLEIYINIAGHQAVKRLYQEQHIKKGNCRSIMSLGQLVEARNFPSATEDDFIWSAALYKWAAECFRDAESKEQALAALRRASALVVHYRREMIDLRMATLRSDADATGQ